MEGEGLIVLKGRDLVSGGGGAYSVKGEGIIVLKGGDYSAKGRGL